MLILNLQGTLARYNHASYNAYLHFLAAGQPRLAYDIAMQDLAIEAAIRNDYPLLRSIFSPFDPRILDDWSFRGKVSSVFPLPMIDWMLTVLHCTKSCIWSMQIVFLSFRFS